MLIWFEIRLKIIRPSPRNSNYKIQSSNQVQITKLKGQMKSKLRNPNAKSNPNNK